MRPPNRRLPSLVLSILATACLANLVYGTQPDTWQFAISGMLAVLFGFFAIIHILDHLTSRYIDLESEHNRHLPGVLIEDLRLSQLRAIYGMSPEAIDVIKRQGLAPIVYEARLQGANKFVDLGAIKEGMGRVPMDFVEEYLGRASYAGGEWLLPPIRDWAEGLQASDSKPCRVHAANIREAGQYVGLVEWGNQNERARVIDWDKFRAFLGIELQEEEQE